MRSKFNSESQKCLLCCKQARHAASVVRSNFQRYPVGMYAWDGWLDGRMDGWCFLLFVI